MAAELLSYSRVMQRYGVVGVVGSGWYVIVGNDWPDRLLRLTTGLFALYLVVSSSRAVRQRHHFIAVALDDDEPSTYVSNPDVIAAVDPQNGWTLESAGLSDDQPGVVILSSAAGAGPVRGRRPNRLRVDGGRTAPLPWGASFHPLEPGPHTLTLSNSALLFRVTSRSTLPLPVVASAIVSYVAPPWFWRRAGVQLRPTSIQEQA